MIRLTQKQKKLIIVTTVIFVVSMGVYLWSQSSNQGSINSHRTPPKKITVNETRLFQGKYITFEYSSQYLVSIKQHQGDDLELYEFNADRPYVKKVAVSVSDLPDGTLSTNSAYLLRKSHTDKFFERKLTPAIPYTEVWSSTDGTKQTVFITRNGRLALFAFTQDGGDKSLYDSEVDSITRSFKWN